MPRWAAAYVATWALLSAGIAWAVEIPQEAWQWRRTLTREGQAVFGLNAPISDLGAQVHAESAWKPKARSPVGAYGLAQFMKPTAEWIAGAYPDLGPEPEPANPVWALRAMAIYDKHLFDRVRASNRCDRFAKALSAYNGGETRLHREEKMAEADGLDQMLWWGNSERYNAGRSKANWRENRDYPTKILFRLSPVYQRADWGPTICDDF